MAILYNVLINRAEKIEDVDIIFTSICCGYGKMDESISIQQILDGIRDFRDYHPQIIKILRQTQLRIWKNPVLKLTQEK